jgi:hypothetical protein
VVLFRNVSMSNANALESNLALKDFSLMVKAAEKVLFLDLTPSY